MSSSSDSDQEEEESQSPRSNAQPLVECSQSLIASLEEALSTLRNPEPDTEKRGVEVGIVGAFLLNLQLKHEDQYRSKVFQLVRKLREVKNNVEDNMWRIRRGLPYQGNDPGRILASMNRQNARR